MLTGGNILLLIFFCFHIAKLLMPILPILYIRETSEYAGDQELSRYCTNSEEVTELKWWSTLETDCLWSFLL